MCSTCAMLKIVLIFTLCTCTVCLIVFLHVYTTNVGNTVEYHIMYWTLDTAMCAAEETPGG